MYVFLLNCIHKHYKPYICVSKTYNMRPFRAKKTSKHIIFTFSDEKCKFFTLESTDMDDFIKEYIEYFQEHYPDQLIAIEQFLRDQHGDRKINNLKKAKWLYNKRVFALSVSCSLSTDALKFSCDENENLNFNFAGCPLRGECPYNGYAEENKDKKNVICNPIYRTSLNEIELNVTDRLINTMNSKSQIAESLNLTDQVFSDILQNIYTKMKVKNRFELKFILTNKRIQ